MKYISVVRAKLKGDNPQAMHDATVEKLSAMTRPLGAIGHQPFLNPQDLSQFLAVDTWNNLENLQKFLANPDVAAAFGQLFDGMPDVSIWGEADWASFMD